MSEFDTIVQALKTTLENLESRKPIDPAPAPVTSTGFSKDRLTQIAQEYIDFTYKSPTIYHVVDYFSKKLHAQGFSYVPEKDSWKDLKPGKYYTNRNGSNLIAFAVGKNWTPSKGVGLIGSHIDSLTVVLKPNSTKQKVDGYELLGVANYAGTLESLWWDRDLGVGGKLIVKDKDGNFKPKLVDSTPHPIGRIPTLAPHFGAPANGPFNKETQAVPVIGYSTSDDTPTDAEKAAPLYGKHPLKLLRYLAKLGDVKVEDIYQTELQLFDVQKGTFGGLNNEFVYAPRVDDRVCSFAAIYALIEADAKGLLADDAFAAVGLYDHEEVGSGTRTGARGGFAEAVIGRVLASDAFVGSNNGADLQENLRLTFANTIILSADVIHLLNPNFSEVYLEHHKPVPNKGVSLTLDPNGHVATDGTGVALVEELARINGDEVQYFQIRNDSRSGGTIGPSISLQTGARTIDLGIPQLSMHSIRAALGSDDIGLGAKFFTGFFANWRNTYDKYQPL